MSSYGGDNDIRFTPDIGCPVIHGDAERPLIGTSNYRKPKDEEMAVIEVAAPGETLFIIVEGNCFCMDIVQQ